MELPIALFWAAWGAIAYTYVGFPLLLALCARVRGRQAEAGAPSTEPREDWPRVAMVVAAWNEAAVLRQKLENTWAIDYPPHLLTLVIGSDGSDDGTPAILEACDDPRLQAHCFAARRGKISVLNDLMAAVDADIVVMSDANTMFSPDAVKRLVRRFSNPAVGCVSGELGLERDGGVSGEGLYWRYENWIKRQESRMGFLIGCNGGIFALRRELYAPLPPNTLVEDFVLTMRILERGFRVEFEPEARATEPACPSARAEMIRKARIGAGGFQAMGMTRALLNPLRGMPAFAYWGHKVLRWLVPLFLVVTLVSNLLLLDRPLYVVLLGAQVAGVLIACWAYLARPGAEPPRWTRPVSYFYLMNYALFCGFIRFLFGTQRVTWKRAFS